MPNAPDRQENLELFLEEYSRPRSDAERRVQRTVLGCDVGLNGYTTIEQADTLSDVLQLSEKRRLLDVGAGRGWPGFHIARSSGCNLVSTDLPLNALLQARATFDAQGLRENAVVTVADGRALPFRSVSFDAVVHADVFC